MSKKVGEIDPWTGQTWIQSYNPILSFIRLSRDLFIFFNILLTFCFTFFSKTNVFFPHWWIMFFQSTWFCFDCKTKKSSLRFCWMNVVGFGVALSHFHNYLLFSSILEQKYSEKNVSFDSWNHWDEKNVTKVTSDIPKNLKCKCLSSNTVNPQCTFFLKRSHLSKRTKLEILR